MDTEQIKAKVIINPIANDTRRHESSNAIERETPSVS